MTRRTAFTLVEMMVALAVTSVLTVMMLKMFSDSSTIWKTEDDRLDTFREARAALQLMSHELANTQPMPIAVAPGTKPTDKPDEFPVLALVNHQTRSNILPADYYKSVFALSSTPNTGKSDLCALGYYLVWEPDISTSSTTTTSTLPAPARSCFVLRRQLTQSDATFNLLKSTLNATTPVFGDAAFSRLYTTSATPAPNIETIASYIWDLEIAVAPPLTAPSAPAATASSGKNAYYGRELPQWIEIRFRALGGNAARQLGGQTIKKELWDKPDDSVYQRFITPHEQQFVSRIKLSR